MHQIKSPPKLATENPKKKIKKLSKTITLPEDPYDPTAFTLHFDQYDEYSLMRRQQMKNAKARKSRHTVKVVGSFSFLMTIGIIITVLCFLCKYIHTTDLGSLIGNTQCGNFRIFLPLRFYVKLILVILKPQKTAILTIWATLRFEFLGTCWYFQVWNVSKNQNSNFSKLLKR